MPQSRRHRDRSVSEIFHQMGSLTLAEWFKVTGKALAIIYAIALAVFLFFSDKFAAALGITAEQIAAGFVLMVAGFFLYLDNRLTVVLLRSLTAPRQLTMREAFDDVFDRYPHVRQLRVYGSTTQLMVQWFESCHRKDEYLFVNKCKILGYRFEDCDFPGDAAHYNTIRDDSFKKWQSFESAQVIGSIEFGISDVLPQTYVVLLDEKAAILGTYVKRAAGPTALLDMRPILIHGISEAEKLIIRTYVEWFDSWFANAYTPT